MVNDNTQDEPTNPRNDLRDGTEGGGAPNIQPGGTPGGTNALSPAGAARPVGRVPEPPTGDKEAAERQDPHRALEGGRTKPSPGAAAQRARDEVADVASESGIDEDNPRQIPEDAPAPDGRTGND